MNKIKKALICGLAALTIAPTAFAKCPNTYEKIDIQKINSVQQLINYLSKLNGTKATPSYGRKTKPTQATATPKVTAAPKATTAPKATIAPTTKPIVTAAPTAKPTEPTVKPKATAKPAETSTVEVNASAIEKEVFDLVNKTRASYGLSQLTWANDLAAVARAHSQDMINRRFFDHTNPDGLSPFDRMRAAGIRYRTAAENIAYGQRTPEAVMNAWMNSSGHRANILNASVKELGVGAVANSAGTIYWTQEFVAR